MNLVISFAKWNGYLSPEHMGFVFAVAFIFCIVMYVTNMLIYTLYGYMKLNWQRLLSRAAVSIDIGISRKG